MRPDLTTLARALYDSTPATRLERNPEGALRDARRRAMAVLENWPDEPREGVPAVDAPQQADHIRLLVRDYGARGMLEALAPDQAHLDLVAAGLSVDVAVQDGQLQLRVDPANPNRVSLDSLTYSDHQLLVRVAGVPWHG